MHQICSKNTTRCCKLSFTSFYVKIFLLRNYNDSLLKNVFCIKSAQKIQLAVETCVLLHFVKKLRCSKLWGYLAKKCVLHQICSKNKTGFWKLCYASFCVQTYFCQMIRISCLKMRFGSNLLKEYNSLLKTLFHVSLCQKLPFSKL